jgi:hypothetical protein
MEMAFPLARRVLGFTTMQSVKLSSGTANPSAVKRTFLGLSLLLRGSENCSDQPSRSTVAFHVSGWGLAERPIFQG